MATDALFTAADLAGFLRRPVTDAEAVVVERVVWGQLKGPLNLDARPEQVSDEVWTWAVELGAIVFANPEGLASYSLAGETSNYGSERRDEILDLAAGGNAGGGPRPRGRFPRARAYPDPAETCRRW